MIVTTQANLHNCARGTRDEGLKWLNTRVDRSNKLSLDFTRSAVGLKGSGSCLLSSDFTIATASPLQNTVDAREIMPNRGLAARFLSFATASVSHVARDEGHQPSPVWSAVRP